MFHLPHITGSKSLFGWGEGGGWFFSATFLQILHQLNCLFQVIKLLNNLNPQFRLRKDVVGYV